MSKYDDIINLPHHVSSIRTPMPMESRAAQFAPFAALTGHDEAINETARLTASRKTLSKRLACALELQSVVTLTHFIPDDLREGGQYVTASGIMKKVDEYEGRIILRDGRSIRLADVFSIEGGIFNDFDD